jgi:hypothetical protein
MNKHTSLIGSSQRRFSFNGKIRTGFFAILLVRIFSILLDCCCCEGNGPQVAFLDKKIKNPLDSDSDSDTFGYKSFSYGCVAVFFFKSTPMQFLVLPLQRAP